MVSPISRLPSISPPVRVVVKSFLSLFAATFLVRHGVSIWLHSVIWLRFAEALLIKATIAHPHLTFVLVIVGIARWVWPSLHSSLSAWVNKVRKIIPLFQSQPEHKIPPIPQAVPAVNPVNVLPKEVLARKGSLKVLIEQIETAIEGDLRLDPNERSALLRQACREFERKTIMGFLADEARKDFAQECPPQVLEKATEWFARFTQNLYKLTTTPSERGGIKYEIIEVETGEVFPISGFSIGTRMLLLLSIRLAFAFYSESKVVFLPMILSEVLTYIPPDRLGIISGVLKELSRNGKQLFYITANSVATRAYLQKVSSSSESTIRRRHAAA